MYYVYILKNGSNDEWYVGSTNDLRRRMREHNEGKVPSTRRYKPWQLLYYEAFKHESPARMREYNLKHHGNAIRELKKRVVLPEQQKNRTQSGAGFTLIEVIIAVAVFSITVVMAVNLFIVFVQQQRRTLNQQELQNDARSVMEQIAKDVREGSVDYEYYAANFALELTKLFSQLSSTSANAECLVLRDSLNAQILYRLNNEVIERLEATTPSLAACNGLAGWEAISPDNLTVASFVFAISPSEDPFAAKSAQECVINDDCRWGTICRDSSGRYVNQVKDRYYCYPQKFNEVTPLHPRVTYSFNFSRTSNQQTISQVFQTTVASRLFKNLDRLNSYVP